MKRIITLVALSALMISSIPAQAGITESARNYAAKVGTFARDCGVKALQGVKNHPYVTAATAATAFCAASIACNEYAKSKQSESGFLINSSVAKLDASKHRNPPKASSRKVLWASRLGFVGKALDALRGKYLELTWDESYLHDKK